MCKCHVVIYNVSPADELKRLGYSGLAHAKGSDIRLVPFLLSYAKDNQAIRLYTHAPFYMTTETLLARTSAAIVLLPMAFDQS